MPEVHFNIRWPDGAVERCYSPSSVVREHLAAGSEYTVADFMQRARRALGAASNRVEQVYGRPCSLAQAQLATLEARYAAAAFPDTAAVRCLEMTPIPATKGATA